MKYTFLTFLLKKWWLILGLLVGILSLVFLTNIWRSPWHKSTEYEAIPANTACFIELKNYSAVQKMASPVGVSWNDFSPVKKFSTDVNNFNLIVKNTPFRTILTTEKIIAAAELSRLGNYDFLYIVKTKDENAKIEQFTRLNEYYNPIPHNFKGQIIYEFKLPNNDILAISMINDLILFSRESILVEQGIEQYKNYRTSITHQVGFKAIQQELSTGNQVVKVFCQTEFISLVEEIFSTPTQVSTLQNINKFADWVGFSWQTEDKKLALSGSFHLKDNYLSAVEISPSQKYFSKIATYLPSNIAIAFQWKFEKDTYLIEKSEYKNYWKSWATGNILYAIIQPTQADFKNDVVLLVENSDPKECKTKLKEWSSELGELKSKKYLNTEIFQVTKTDFLKPLLGLDLNTIQNPYYTILNNYVLFSNSEATVKGMIDRYNFNQTLPQNFNYLTTLKDAPDKKQGYFYADMNYMLSFFPAFLNLKTEEEVQKVYQQWKNLTTTGLRLSRTQNLLNFEGKIIHNRDSVVNIVAQNLAKSGVLWRTELKNVAATEPFLLKNHLTGEDELMIQDRDNNLYLLNKSGEILWEKPMPSPILSKIYQIDYFTNTELQYLFNTKDNIYLLNRKGEMLSGYPIKLNSPATNGLMMLDYIRERQEKFFVACANGNVYGFEKSGKPLSGWSPVTDGKKISLPLLHFLSDRKDYLMTINEAGTLRAYKPDGTLRLNPINLKKLPLNSIGFDEGASPCRIVHISPTGLLSVVRPDNSVNSVQLKVGNNKNVHYAVVDIMEDKQKEYIAVSDTSLMIYGYNGGKFHTIKSMSLKSPITDIFEVSSEQKEKKSVGLISHTNQRIYLLDENQEIRAGFPLSGTTRFNISDLLGTGQEVLTVANGKIVYAYEL